MPVLSPSHGTSPPVVYTSVGPRDVLLVNVRLPGRRRSPAIVRAAADLADSLGVPVARVRLNVAERREELLRAAVEQIEIRGVSSVRIADVAQVLGVSNALVLYHFSTKEKLVAAAFAYAAEADLAHLRDLLARRTTAVRRLRARPCGGTRPERPRAGGCGSRGLGRLAARRSP